MQTLTVGMTKHDRITTTLNIEGENKALVLTFRWHTHTEQWTMSVQNEDGSYIVTHIPILCGTGSLDSNLLRMFGHLGIGTMGVFPVSDDLVGVDPTGDNMEDEYLILWG